MTARRVLWDLAVEQYGFVTAEDAADHDISLVTLQKFIKRGALERHGHGLYRFPDLPATEYDSYMRAVLWTGVREACLSHETALALYDVSDINPTRVHITLPKARRIRRTGGEGYEVHYEDLPPAEIGWLHQIRATKFAATVRQCIHTGVPNYLLNQALEAGQRRGLVMSDQRANLEAQLDERDARG
jgi:predicted transcriptional regulator of viral defense system